MDSVDHIARTSTRGRVGRGIRDGGGCRIVEGVCGLDRWGDIQGFHVDFGARMGLNRVEGWEEDWGEKEKGKYRIRKKLPRVEPRKN